MLSRNQKLCAGFLFLNLFFGIWSAFSLPYPNIKFFTEGFAVLREYTGSNYRWGFFAPSIGSQFRLSYELKYPGGRVVTGQLGDHGPEESIMRMQGVVGTFWFALKDKVVRRSLCASWATYLFARNPNVEEVTILIDSFKIPSMADFRSGDHGKWLPAYEGHFLRDDERVIESEV